MLFLKTKEKNLIKKIAQQYSLELLLLFGSKASGKTHKQSDFDIAYLSKRELNLMEEAQLICDLMPVFKSDKVDLANLKKASPVLMKQIFDNHIILFCRNPKVYALYQIYAMKKFIEAKPLFELRSKFINDFLKQHGYR